MGIAGGEIAIRVRVARILLDRQEKFRHRLIEAPSEEMCGAYYHERSAGTGARAKTQSGFDMLDRDVGLARPKPDIAADEPAAGEIRIERQGAVDQRHHGADVLAKIGQRKGGICEDDRIVAGYFQSSPCEIGTLRTMRLPVFAPTVIKQASTADRSPGERPARSADRARSPAPEDEAPRRFVAP